jgi:hypothetical protein
MDRLIKKRNAIEMRELRERANQALYGDREAQESESGSGSGSHSDSLGSGENDSDSDLSIDDDDDDEDDEDGHAGNIMAKFESGQRRAGWDDEKVSS